MEKFQLGNTGYDPLIRTENDRILARFGHLNTIIDKLNESGTSDYKSYVVSLSQAGDETDPIVIFEKNNIGGTPVWTRNALGKYQITNTGKFTSGKTLVFCSFGNSSGDKFLNYYIESTDVIGLINYNASVPSTEDGFDNVSIEIRVYN